ncbi:hypoxanthine phosphoribosyltransferase [Elusimicrobiota bacterium]
MPIKAKTNKKELPPLVDGVLFSSAQISKRIKDVAGAINRDYKDKDLVIISILKGSFVFLADLVRQLKVSPEIDFMNVSSYEGDKSTGMVHLHFDIRKDIKGKDVLLLDDIVDTGISLSFARNHLKNKEPNSLEVAVLMDKPSKRKVFVPIRYVGFTISDKFVIGYGLDYNEHLRELPYIGTLKPGVANING